MKVKPILMNKLQELIDSNYREGFNDSVLSHCKQALIDNGFEIAGRQLWNDVCCGKKWTSDSELLAKYNEAEALSKKEGCFVMPEWGTKGT
jgi:hypothetical protein